jgi:branched-chain amino acid transport system ATP-binding protein
VTTLEVTGLSVRYGHKEAVKALDISVDQGRVCAILGANGAGKTSTLRGISGLIRHTKGRVWLDSERVDGWPAFKIARRGLVMVPEGRRVFASLTVQENLLLGAYVERSRRRQGEQMSLVHDLFPVLAERRSTSAGFLSGGEQQMLAFGRAMMSRPKIILMDEPSLGLAPVMVQRIMNFISTIASTGIGILIVEQNARAALRISDHAVVLERGTLVVSGPASEIRSNPEVARAFLGSGALPPV